MTNRILEKEKDLEKKREDDKQAIEKDRCEKVLKGYRKEEARKGKGHGKGGVCKGKGPGKGRVGSKEDTLTYYCRN